MSWLGKMIGGNGAAATEVGRGGSLVAGAKLIIGRQEYGLAELGVRTFRIHPYSGELIWKQNFSFNLVITVDKEEHTGAGFGVVRELSDKRGLVAQFAPPQPVFDKKLMEFLAQRRLAQKTVKRR